MTSVTSRDKLVQENLHLIEHAIDRLSHVTALSHISREDLFSYGAMGLIQGIDKYDSERGSNLQAFVLPRIRGAIYDYLRQTDQLKRSTRSKVKTLSRHLHSLTQENGYTPDQSTLAQKMGISLDELRDIQNISSLSALSLNNTEGESELSEQLSDQNPTPEENCEWNMLREQILNLIEALPLKEKQIVKMHHFHKMEIREIAELLKISRSRAYQLYNRGICALRQKLI